LLYVATEDNFAHLGEASDLAIARQIAASHGPSGSNREYLANLHSALSEMGATDAHVARLHNLVTSMACT
jgi:cation transport regulator ChaC